MPPRPPSLTARGAAGHRAAHQALDGAAIFRDPFARRLLGAADCAWADARAADPRTRPLRLFIAARSRFAEDKLAAAVARGVRQAVALGAGLDTFALRNPWPGVRVFEVDHPATQAWKRERLKDEDIAIPATLTFVPVDLEREDLYACLSACGLVPDQPAFFIWLGVVPYLSREAIVSVLRPVARRHSEIVFDYGELPENRTPDERARAEAFAARVARAGEPLVSWFEPAALHTELRRLGFGEIEDVDAAALAARYVHEMDVGPFGGGHVLRARA
ncbi:MAG TPA: class I SAM-dependent methyltransferase [Rhizomicrobium sp.]|nr:class I SAM-dependent methyltransferase [Rhizomicrobium sp.]